jgi:beta-lactamase class A
MLRRNFDYEEIPRLLPAGVAVAHKTGKLSASRSDCGVVYNKGKDYILCIFTRDNQDQSWRIDTEARVTIGELARMVHDGISSK